jgi:hypothetical protein
MMLLITIGKQITTISFLEHKTVFLRNHPKS